MDRKELITALAEVFSTETAAQNLLEEIGIPRARLPNVGQGNAEQFWHTALRELDHGLSPRANPLESLIRAALERYPGNETFKAFLQFSADAHRAGTRPWLMPYRRNPFFVGREDVLSKLRESLTRDGAAALSQIQAISGLGGIGKTQTSVEYAYLYRDTYEAVFFVRAETEAEIRTGFGEIARKLGLGEAQEQEEIVQGVLAWLEEQAGWLLIFDNADKPELVKPFLPVSHRGHVLVTSRARVLAVLGIVEPFEMDTMPAAEALAFLLKRSGRPSPGAAERAAARELAKELGYLPLALEQAGAYIQEKQSQFQTYLKSYRKRGLDLLERGIAQEHREPVATTWSLNFQEVEKTSPASADVLRLSAFLSPDDIPLAILIGGAAELGPVLSESLADAEDDVLVIDEMIDSLELKPDSSQAFNWAGIYLWHRARYAEAEPLYQRSLEIKEKALGKDHPEVAQTLGNLGLLYSAQGRNAEAEPLYQRSLEITEKALGKAHPEVARVVRNYAALLRETGREDEAVQLENRPLPQHRRTRRLASMPVEHGPASEPFPAGD